ncbi:hypothetical protein HK098_000304 [Nowakowskiella sp. JEL0407]|nr:hypothetical protein HK098_000297 [Nowakowskiella sp. JEL0407]KAJ3125416.1 hypothetical protein HK098_000304 [Nowakowskiella sp. JEL0407]
MDSQTFTITFGDQAETHVGMEKLGEMSSTGFDLSELMKAKNFFESKGCETELIYLNENLPSHLQKSNDSDETQKVADAYVLIARSGLTQLLPDSKTSDDFFNEQSILEKDKKALMYGRVVQKTARHNLCFADEAQSPDYSNGQGRVYSFDDSQLTLLKCVRQKLPKVVGEKANGLVAEGNYYYDLRKCGIGFHGDAERRIVVGIRVGAKMRLDYHWFQESKSIGSRAEIELGHGDVYFMSEKAVGTDWKKKKVPTLRHAAGAAKYLEIKNSKKRKRGE